MEDILIIDNNTIEESVIDETEFKDNQLSDSDFGSDKSLNEDVLKEEESINEFKQVDKPDGIILGSNDINNYRSVEVINLDNFNQYNLWVNNDSSINFTPQNVTLNGNISDFDFILFKIKASTGTNVESSFILSKDFVLSTGSGTYKEKIVIGNYSWGGPSYVRQFYDISDNVIYIDNCKQAGSSGNNYNDTCIPVSIIGLNYKTLSNNEISVNPSVSGNNITNNYYITVSGNETSLSYNLLNKPLNEYSVSESLIGMSVLFMLAFGFVLLMRKAVFRWR